MTRRVDPNAGMDADTLARIAASDANTRGIIAGRRRAAAALLVTTRDPEVETRDNWEPLRQAVKGAPVAPVMPVAPVVPSPGEDVASEPPGP